MSNLHKLPVIAGVEIAQDEEGRFNLNTLHRASKTATHKRPSKWLATPQAKELITELESQSPHEGLARKLISSVKGGAASGTFAHELIAVSYAGWISPSFQLKVNQAFLDSRKNPEIGTLEWIDMVREKEEQRLLLEQEKQQLECQILEFKPKVEFCDKVTNSEDAISVSQAAKVIGTGQKRLFAYMRQHKWVNRRNEPYQFMINSGYLDVKLGQFNHPSQGLVNTVTALVTGKGLIKLEEEYRRDHPV